jgi:putative Mg2+ transporter-C (MgtC) family protein
MHAALVLQSIRSTTLSGDGGEPARARVRAEVVTEGRSDRAIEQVVGRLSLEPGVSEASWRIADPTATD